MLLNILILEVPSCIYIEFWYYRWDSSCLRSHRSLEVERSHNDDVARRFGRLLPRGQNFCLHSWMHDRNISWLGRCWPTNWQWYLSSLGYFSKKIKITFKWSDSNLSAIFRIRNVIFQKWLMINIIRSALKIHTLYFKCNYYLLGWFLQ